MLSGPLRYPEECEEIKSFKLSALIGLFYVFFFKNDAINAMQV